MIWVEELIKSEVMESLSINYFFKDFRYAWQKRCWSVVVEIMIIIFFVDGKTLAIFYF